MKEKLKHHNKHFVKITYQDSRIVLQRKILIRSLLIKRKKKEK